MSTESELPEPCSTFLAGLADWALGRGPGVEHVRTCAACADRVRAARQTAALLRGLPAPELPAGLAEPAFLERIHEAIARSSAESEVGVALSTGLTRKPMPLDPGWEGAVAAGAPTRTPALDSLEPKSAPAWLWARIREDVRVGLAERRQHQRRTFALRLAAAVILVAGASIGFWANHRAHGGLGGTKSPSSPVGEGDIAFVTVEAPFAVDVSPSLLVRDLARAPTSGR